MSDTARLLKEGWKTNGVFWWFEDSGEMTLKQALSYLQPKKEEEQS